MTARNMTAAIALVVFTGLLASGCGRKAGLDTPYEAALDAREQAEKDGEPLPPAPEPPNPDRPFILDGLID